jgi:hypothetical protein
MTRKLDLWIAEFVLVALGAGLTAGSVLPCGAFPLIEKPGINAVRTNVAFATVVDAESFLERVLPAATAANPKYRSPGGETETRWLTKEIAFPEAKGGGVMVSTHEDIENFRGGALSSRGTHEAVFAIDDVTIAPETVASDVAENGEKAIGVIFRCVGTPCIHADWSGEKSLSAWTDIYVQDPTQRDQILAAFQALQGKANSK